MDFDDEIEKTAIEFGITLRDAAIIVAQRICENPQITPTSRAMLEVMIADLQRRKLSWH